MNKKTFQREVEIKNMKNLKQLLGICEHKWIIIRGEQAYLRNYIIQCEKCGLVKKVKTPLLD